MDKKECSLINSVVKNCDRASDGNLKIEAREKIIKSLKKYLENTGRANISEISAMLGLSRQTTKNLIDEILIEWHQEIEDQTLVQSKWVESILRDIDQDTRIFGKEEIAMINLKSSMLSKLNALQKLALKNESFKIYIVKRDETKELGSPNPL